MSDDSPFATPISPQAADSLKAIVVTKHENLRRLLKENLEKAGVVCEFCDVPSDVFGISENAVFDMIFMDRFFQDWDAETAIDKLQGSAATKQAWILILIPRSSEFPAFYSKIKRETVSLIPCPFGHELIQGFLAYVLPQIKRCPLDQRFVE